jgi:putative transposase
MYTRREKEAILAQFHASGLKVATACRTLPGFPCRELLRSWLRDEEAGLLAPPAIEPRGRAGGRAKHRRYPEETKREALRLLAQGVPPSVVARRLGVSSGSVVSSWARRRRGKLGGKATAGGRGPSMGGEAHGDAGGKARGGAGAPEQTAWRDWAADLPEDPAGRQAAMERKYAEMSAVLDVLKAPGPGSLSRAERAMAAMAAGRAGTSVSAACRDLGVARSTCYALAASAAAPDKYAALRERVRAVFAASGGVYGPEPVWAALRSGMGPWVRAADLAPGDLDSPVRVSEKVVRRIMREEGLVPARTRSQAPPRYDSYRGELSERPENVPLGEDGTHRFRADAPFELVVTDVTMFSLNGFRCYLSPAIDCFDGDPIAWRISRRPDDDLTDGTLRDAMAKAGPGTVVHTDGGGNYMSRRWIADCAELGAVRSMSRKARSPDNARAEGFFGTLKEEFFYCRDWAGIGYGEFAAALGEYLAWYRDGKIKKALGWKTIREFREERGIAV